MPHPSLRRYFRHGLLPQLVVFEAVSRLQNATRAAEELHLAQPTVSTQIKKLSSALGTPLLEQRAKRWELTPAGELVATASREIMEVLARLEAGLAVARARRPGPLRISAAPGGRHVAARLLAAFCVRHPGVQASLHIGGVEEILARLANGEDEFSVVLSSRKPDGLETTPVGTEQLCVYARAGHPLAGQPRIDPRLLAREPVVLREPGSAMRDAFLDACGLNIGELVVRAELGSNEAIAEAIARGVGVGLLPEMEAEALIQAGALAALDVRGLPLARCWVLARVRGKPASLAGELFARECAEDLTGSPVPHHSATL